MRDRLDNASRLATAFAAARGADECRRFLVDLCTPGELRALAQRLEVARMLRGDATYDEVAAATRASSATISRVKKYLNSGMGGYRAVLERLEGGRP